MTIHYHGTPITPTELLYQEMAGAHFCVSHWQPQQIRQAHEIGQTVLLDNGAFSAWLAGAEIEDWGPYYEWVNRWLEFATTWAIIPDVITGSLEQQEALIRAWPHGERGAPVWHLHEPIERLLELADAWPRVCFGSSAQFRKVLSPAWCRRVDEAWRELDRRHARTPWMHMLRGMQICGQRWPFASVDSTDIARNHNRDQNTPAKMRRRWDQAQNPSRFICRGEQRELVL
jgi:hypothetical protein